jgi:hypothetical protein
VAAQTEGCWYQFREGAFMLVLKTTDPIIITTEWAGATLRLIYETDGTLVPPHNTGSPTFKEVSCSVEGDTITYLLKVDEITRNHQSKAFCFSFHLGDLIIATSGFLVMTKRTKRKKAPRRSNRSEVEYKKQAREVLQRLQWRIGGYTSTCTGFVDFTSPIFTCGLCNGQKTQGHVAGCPLIVLL